MCAATDSASEDGRWGSIWGNSLRVPSKKLNMELSCDPTYPKSCETLRQLLSYQCYCSAIHSSRKVLTTQTTVEWIKQNTVCTDHGRLFSHKKKTLTQAPRWMNPENIMLREISQTRNDDYGVWNAWDRQLPRDRKQISGDQGLGVGNIIEWVQHFCFGWWKKVLEINGAGGCTTLWMSLNTTKLYT